MYILMKRKNEGFECDFGGLFLFCFFNDEEVRIRMRMREMYDNN